MAGPTTEVLNQDLKDVRNDLKNLNDDVKQLGTKIEVVCGQLNLLASLAIIAIGLIGGLLSTGLVTGIWWESGISSDVRHLETEVSEIRKSADQPKKEIVGPAPLSKSIR
jgi:hypothetical protein